MEKWVLEGVFEQSTFDRRKYKQIFHGGPFPVNQAFFSVMKGE
jgi:hypothetical protein